MPLVDSWIAAILLPLSIWILISGLDDLWIDLVWLYSLLRQKLVGNHLQAHLDPQQFHSHPEKLAAILVPLWREHTVIERMVEHNLSALKYSNFHIFLGVYPNDTPTRQAVEHLSRRFSNVHMALCPHNGPTSKADNLNWIYQHVLLFEEQKQVRFEFFVIHDAEDLIHPEELAVLNYYLDSYDMVQVPVLALQTPVRELTHGVYCDDFAEYQLKELHVRQKLGGFLPSSGVGTGYRREIIEQLAQSESNRLFEPEALTEDYENGLKLYRLGARQLMLPFIKSSSGWVATREYFPRIFDAAVRQRTRWIMGIALQSWQRNGWGKTLREAYWFWRDRKGLVGNPTTLLANLILFYGTGTLAYSLLTNSTWGLAVALTSSFELTLLWITFFLQLWRISLRVACVSYIYGPAFASWVPFRILWANWLNCFATVEALAGFCSAWLRNRPLVWVKTEHAYPNREALLAFKPRIGEILIRCGFLTASELAEAIQNKPPSVRLGEYLVGTGRLKWEHVYMALSQQHHLPLLDLSPAHIPKSIARILPKRVSLQYKVIAFHVQNGTLELLTPEIPTEQLQAFLKRYTRLNLKFSLITPDRFEELKNHAL